MISNFARFWPSIAVVAKPKIREMLALFRALEALSPLADRRIC